MSFNLSQSVCRKIMPLVSEYCDTLGRSVTSKCNDAVVNINSTQKLIGWHYEFLKYFSNVSVRGC